MGTTALNTPLMPPMTNMRQEAEDVNSSGVSKRSRPPHIVAIQLKIFTPVGTAIIIVAAMKKRFNTGLRPVVNMWCAQTRKPSRADRGGRVRDGLVAEDRLARKDRQHFGDDAHRGQHHDVHRRMRVEPEHVLPHGRIAARAAEELRAKVAIEAAA